MVHLRFSARGVKERGGDSTSEIMGRVRGRGERRNGESEKRGNGERENGRMGEKESDIRGISISNLEWVSYKNLFFRITCIDILQQDYTLHHLRKKGIYKVFQRVSRRHVIG